MKKIRLLNYSFPLGIVSFFFISMETVMSFPDEDYTILGWGFPFPWYTKIFLGYSISVVMLIIDIIFYVSISHLLVSFLFRTDFLRVKKYSIILKILSGFIWLATLVVVFFVYFFIYMSYKVTWVSNDQYGHILEFKYYFHFCISGLRC
jgi:hypothetical protein